MADLSKPTKQQSLDEIRQWDVDFSADLTVGASVVSAIVEHVPPSGAASTPTVGSIVANVVPLLLGPLTVIGTHKLNVLATISNGEKSQVQIQLKVVDY